MPDVPLTQAEQIALLSAAITRSGLSIGEYARTVLVRSPRTVERWLSGKQRIPQAVLDVLVRPVAKGDGITDDTAAIQAGAPIIPGKGVA